MEQGFGSASESVDKSRVLEVKPLRCLVPVFPNPPGMSSVSTPQPTPFVCVPPSGPFPPGVQPFYPFLAPNGTQQTPPAAQNPPSDFGFGTNIPAPVPLNSFRTPPQANGTTSRSKRVPKTRPSKSVGIEDDGLNESSEFGTEFTDPNGASNSGNRRVRPRRKAAENGGDGFDVDALVNTFLTSYKLNEFDDFRRSNGDNGTVGTILLVFDLIRRKLTQLEETKELAAVATRRPDLKAGTLLMTKGIRTNNMKRIGHIPGIEVGDIFFFRMELCLVGVHAPSMAGIDYMSVKLTKDEEPVAVSIVSSGGYDDEGNDGDVLIYSGQGGVQRRDGQMFDQKLERGNLALEKSLHRANDVRVIRGIKENNTSNAKIYVYDGLYKIRESWAEKKSGCNVFKYKLVRVPGQPEAFTLLKLIQQWKDGTATRTGVILPDLASGSESLPVALVNEVDGEKVPPDFTYISTLKYSKPFTSSEPSVGCNCVGGCQPDDTSCPCNRRNDGYLPYSSNGILLTNKSLIHECGLSCSCPPNCRNRMSQTGIKVRVEVFKTKNRGWGLRSWDIIRAGAFICEFAGDVVKAFPGVGDNYVFDATRYYEPLEVVRENSTEYKKAPFPLVISAKNNGNVGRFMNHSCSPNVYWQPVLRESNNESYLHVGFFAIRHIPPMQELTYDYGMVSPDKRDKGKKKCFCGSVKCKGYFY